MLIIQYCQSENLLGIIVTDSNKKLLFKIRKEILNLPKQEAIVKIWKDIPKTQDIATDSSEFLKIIEGKVQIHYSIPTECKDDCNAIDSFSNNEIYINEEKKNSITELVTFDNFNPDYDENTMKKQTSKDNSTSNNIDDVNEPKKNTNIKKTNNNEQKSNNKFLKQNIIKNDLTNKKGTETKNVCDTLIDNDIIPLSERFIKLKPTQEQCEDQVDYINPLIGTLEQIKELSPNNENDNETMLIDKIGNIKKVDESINGIIPLTIKRGYNKRTLRKYRANNFPEPKFSVSTITFQGNCTLVRTRDDIKHCYKRKASIGEFNRHDGHTISQEENNGLKKYETDIMVTSNNKKEFELHRGDFINDAKSEKSFDC